MIIDVQERMKLINQKRKWVTAPRVQNIEFVEVEFNSGWFKKSETSVSFGTESRTFTSALNSTEYTYLTYREQNLDFQKGPEEEIIKPASPTETIVFKGSSNGAVIELFIIEYGEDGKLSTHRVEMNGEQTLTFSEEVQQIRLAIRVKGSGSFKIEQLLIGEENYWNQNELSTAGNYIVLEQNQWYIPKSNKLYYNPWEKTFHINFPEKQFAYLTHREGNASFSTESKLAITLNVDKLSVVFNGEKDSAVDLRLAFIFYRNGQKVETTELNLATQKLIVVPEKADSMRLAIRAAGQGEFSIHNLIINNVSYWWNKDIKWNAQYPLSDTSYKLLLNQKTLVGWEESNNQVVYSPWNRVFESKLQGNEFIHLHCLGANENSTYRLTPKKDYNYTIIPVGQTDGDVEVSVLAVGYKNGKKVEFHQLALNNQSPLRFQKDTDYVEFLVRVTGQGFFKGLKLCYNEEPIEITNQLELDLKDSNWFIGSKKALQLSSQEKSLEGHADIEDGKNVYMSYKETNNSFKMLPTHHLMTMQNGFEYEFFVKGKVEEGVTVIPMFIGYSDNEKVQVLQLKFNSLTRIQPHPDVKQFRVALRISGKGDFLVDTFDVNEMKTIEAQFPINYMDKAEVDAFKTLPSKSIREMKMAVIFDEFTTASYEHECTLIKMTPDNWLEVMTKEQPDLLMVESAWRGNGGVWDKQVGYYGEENMKPLFSMLQWCKEHNVPTVFWNKEDPVHFNRFIETAKRFDYIFTTDENMVPFYQEHAGHQNAFSLPFAAQPAIHNPTKIVDKRENKACFAGSYYRRHEERCIDMDRLLDAAAKVGLDIYDRNYVQNLKGLMPNHQFPDRFQPFIKGNLKYYEIDKAYKGYQVMINVNTVKESPTMFSRRVYEGLACGTPVISTYAQGIEEIFGDLVYMSENPESLYEEFKKLLEDERYYEQKALTGIRDVLTKHTYTHRLKYIIEKVGLNFVATSSAVTVVACANSLKEYEEIVEQFNRQTYENKQLYILVDTFDGYLNLYNKYNTATIHTFVRSYMHNYLNIRDWISSPYVTYFDKESYYGSNYLLDLMLSTTFTDSDFIGKATYYTLDQEQVKEQNEGREYEYVTDLSPERTVAKTTVYSNVSLEKVIEMFEQNQRLASYARYGKQFFSNDKFNYLKIKNHTDKKLDSILKQVEL